MSTIALLGVFLGGGAGACLRWLLGHGCRAVFPAFGIGVIAANLLGCFCIGLVAGYADRHGGLSEPLRAFVVTGVLGGFTTFSAFSLEAVSLMRTSPAHAALYVGGQVAACLFATYCGHGLASR